MPTAAFCLFGFTFIIVIFFCYGLSKNLKIILIRSCICNSVYIHIHRPLDTVHSVVFTLRIVVLFKRSRVPVEKTAEKPSPSREYELKKCTHVSMYHSNAISIA